MDTLILELHYQPADDIFLINDVFIVQCNQDDC